MQHLRLLGDQTPEELWWLTNATIPGFLCLLFLPRWKPTMYISLLGPILMAIVYTLGILSVTFYPEKEPDPNASFFSLQGVMTIFQDEAGVFIGWVHYIVFDALVARWIVIDSIETKGLSMLEHILIIIPSTFFTLMFGPMGWLLYIIVRNFIPDAEEEESNKEKKH